MSLGPNAGGASNSEPVVRIDYGDAELDAPFAPSQGETPPRRAAAALLVALAAGLGLLFWLDRQPSDVAEPADAAPHEPVDVAPLESQTLTSDPAPALTPESVAPGAPRVPPHLITSISPLRTSGDEPFGEWVGVVREQERLVRSHDGGISWFYSLGNNVLAVGEDDTGQARMLTRGTGDDSGLVTTLGWDGSTWQVDERMSIIDVGDSRIVHAATGEQTTVIVELPTGIVVFSAMASGGVQGTELEASALPGDFSTEWLAGGDRLIADGEGTLTLLTPAGIHRSPVPYDEWELVTLGPFDREVPGQEFGMSLYGVGFFANDPRGGSLFWVSCCGDDGVTGTDWNSVVTPGSDVAGVLIATGDVIIFHTATGEVVAVRPAELDWG